MATRLADGSRVTMRGNGFKRTKPRSAATVKAEWDALLDWVEVNNAVPAELEDRWTLPMLQHAVKCRKEAL